MEFEYVAEWFQFADMDLASADYLQGLLPQPLEIICYHCQQSVEKYLKGYLIYNGINEPPKIHNLVELCESCSTFDERFNELSKFCGVLTRYGVGPRYPREMEVSEHDMRKALEYAHQIRDSEPLVSLRNEIPQYNEITKEEA